MKEIVKLNKETYDKMVEDIRMLNSAYAITYQDGWGREYMTKEWCKELADATTWSNKEKEMQDELDSYEKSNKRIEYEVEALRRELNLSELRCSNLKKSGIKLFGFRITV